MPRPDPSLHRRRDDFAADNTPMPPMAKALLAAVLSIIALVVIYRYLSR